MLCWHYELRYAYVEWQQIYDLLKILGGFMAIFICR